MSKEKFTNYLFQYEIEGLKISESYVHAASSMKTRHYHETIELFVLTEGERYYFVDRFVYHMKKHMALLIPPGQIHKTSAVSGKPEHGRFLLQYSKEVFGTMIQNCLGISYEEFCLKYSGMISLSDIGYRRLQDKFSELKEEASKSPDDPDYSSSIIKCLSFELLLIFSREVDKEKAALGIDTTKDSYLVKSGIYNTIQKVTEYINNNYHSDISLDSLADRFYISRAGLTRSFKNITGITIVQYLTTVRIRRACNLLKNSSDSITDIAQECGFGNVTYFEKVFRRIHGMTPRQYRNIPE